MAARLFGYFPTSGAASDPEIFATGIVQLLAAYSLPAVESILSPLSGMPAKHKFLPSIGEIREALEDYAAHDRRMADYEHRFLPNSAYLPKPEPETRPTIEQLRAKYGENWGLKDPLKPEIKKIPWDQQVLPWSEIKITTQLADIVRQWVQEGKVELNVSPPDNDFASDAAE